MCNSQFFFMFRRFSLINVKQQNKLNIWYMQRKTFKQYYVVGAKKSSTSITLNIRRQKNCDASIIVISLYSLSTITQYLCMYCIISLLETLHRDTSLIIPVLGRVRLGIFWNKNVFRNIFRLFCSWEQNSQNGIQVFRNENSS